MSKRIEVNDLNVYYGDFLAVEDVSMTIEARSVTALIGPSGCGKSTFLRTLNRMHEVIPGARVKGKAVMDGQNLYAADVDPVEVRRQVGMVFQRPNPFPTMSIAENVLAGVKLNNKRISKSDAEDLVEQSLSKANLWKEVKDRLARPGSSLSGGQQQRLCIARAIAVKPDVLLMDEPCSALDPISTLAIEDLMAEPQGRLHDRRGHPQHAAGRARERPDGVLQHRRYGQARQAHRDGRHLDDVLLADAAGHRGLHLGPLRVIVAPGPAARRSSGGERRAAGPGSGPA